MTVAVSYSFVKSSRRNVFGIQVAILDWLKSYLKYSAQEKFPFLVLRKESFDEIVDNARQVGIDTDRLEVYYPDDFAENLGKFSAVFRIDPMPGNLLWHRSALKNDGFAFCGLAHAMAGIDGGKILEKYCLEPTERGDAIVCPSHAIKFALQSFFDTYGDYINQRFGVKFRCPVRLPIIPLGINLERFDKICTPEKRAQQRKNLGLDDNDKMILWVGRLSHIIKAHPLAMFRAAEEAAKRTGAKVHLVMMGYFAPEDAEAKFKNLARDFCKTAEVHFISSDDERFPDGLWAAGDIFLSLIDNIQESFGLTPIEAIAANLPRVISDWDGYRDCVTHGTDGFLVRTTQPPSGQGAYISSMLLGGREMHADFLSKTALTTAVDHHMAADALISLINNPDLGKQMAEKARLRLPNYNWKNIIPAYEALWDELGEERKRNSCA
ncbi:MAG: glycosyltransferase family 4 protein [Alphaproteobacteria bacterium]|nr:glycosyltransferase family 4 protein [Alphaproteobacteria bacterium]